MQTAHRLIACAALACLCWLLAECALTVRRWRSLPEELIAVTDSRAAEAVALADEQISLLRRNAREELAQTRRELREEIAISRVGLLARADAAGAAIDQRTAAIEQAAVGLLSRATDTATEAAALLADVRANQRDFVRRIDYWTDCEQNGLCWQGLLTDTLMQTRQSALAIGRAVPDIVRSADGAARGIQATAEASAQTSANLARLTQPGPRWLRYVGLGASIAVPVSQVALPFAVRSAR
jgi:hypothetical protein